MRYASIVAIKLADFERGAPFSGDFAAALKALQDRLAVVQLAQVVHQRRVVIVIEGAECTGKNDLIKCLATGLDPCHFSVHCISPDRRRSSEGHWLARYWNKLPGVGCSSIFYHSWYRRVLEDQLMHLVTDKEHKRAYDEINEFEAQQRDYDTLLIKLFLHASDDVLDRRFADRSADRWRRHLTGPEELRTPAGRRSYRQAVERMFELTDTRWAPWTVIDANDHRATLVAGLTAVSEAMEKVIPLQPPEAEEVVTFAELRERFRPA